ncbi:MAG: glycosyltransferase family 2 protein [Clostridia bacterium]|nr:glycosyltransferase family 2 protein [Clostridia bacterium]
MTPILYIVIPCYNEQQVLPETAPMFLSKLTELIDSGEISNDSRVMFVNDGSRDNTWEIISALSKENEHYVGLSLSRNRGHQNALLCGLMEAKDMCDITVSIDCDGQDDINAINEMVKEYKGGCDIVYGVRNSRKKDSFFKRNTAQLFYKLLSWMGANVVYNHADYRLMSSKALNELAKFKEVNIYLRGMVPLIGFKSTSVYYERNERIAGESHYPLSKMLKLAFDGITSLSIKPMHIITTVGIVIMFLSLAGIVWSVVAYFLQQSVAGWASTIALICFFGGAQLLSIGIIGEYIGKIYMETKNRPRYIVGERTWEADEKNADNSTEVSGNEE